MSACCYYCDQFDRVCAECNGSGISIRKAGERNTSPPLPVYDFLGRAYAGDILIHLANTRRSIARCRTSPSDRWRLPALQAQHAHFRAIAYH